MTKPHFDFTRCVNIAPLYRGSDSNTDQMVARILIEHGSLIVTGFPGCENVGTKMTKLLGFFDASDRDKLTCATSEDVPGNPNHYRGYRPFPKKPNWTHSETFDIGPEPPMTLSGLPGALSFREANAWPSEETMPGWKDQVLSVMAFQRELTRLLLGSLARGLGIETERLLTPARGRNATMRLLHYAAAPPEFRTEQGLEDDPVHIEDGRQLLTRSHVDIAFLALIWQSPEGGLQMKGADDQWREVPAVSDGLSVHCGDLLEALTGGRIKATPHRVVGSGSERRSLGFWLEPDFETEIVSPGGESLSYAQYLVSQFPDRFLSA